jgi:membrane-associated phospholipid phosphatase
MRRSRLLDATVPAAVFAATVSGVLVLADSAREHDGVSANLDPRVAADVLDARAAVLTHAAKLFTLLGSEPVVGALALLLVVLLLERRGPFLAGCAAGAMAVSAALTVGVKLLVERARPGAVDRLGPLDSSYSFPSGHTLNSAVLLGLVTLLLIPLIRARGRRIVAVIAAGSVAVAIGLSRVYLGYHWASDVLASWLIAVAILACVRIAIDVVPEITVRRRSGSRA